MARRDSRKNARRPVASGGAFKILFGGVLLGLVVAGVMAWYLLPREGDFRKVESVPAVRPPPPPAIVSPEPENPATAPDYTFYDILPGNTAPKPAPAAPAAEQWWLQVAALKNAEDADALRAKLTLLNLNAIVLAGPGTPPLHRVRVGPYPSQDTAESVRETLTVNNFEARLLKEPVSP